MRIKLYYGPEYGLDIESRENVGTTTRISIPFKVVME
jgi:two-component system sensor histidine kinase YesM